jgi:hypothetical protein
MRRSLTFVAFACLFALLVCTSSSAAPATPTPTPATAVPYDATCHVPIPDGVVVRWLPDPTTCIESMSNALRGLANKANNAPLLPPPEIRPQSFRAPSFGSFAASAMAPATDAYDDNTSGYAIYNNGDSSGILSYMGATYPYNNSSPADGHAYQIWTEAIQPAQACNSVGIDRVRNDYAHYLSGQADLIVFINSCTAGTQYTWGLNDPGVQQQIIITTQTGPVAAANIHLTGGTIQNPCFTSYIFNKVTGTWNSVATVCSYDLQNWQGYVEFAGISFGASPLWCPTLPNSPWVEATLKYKNAAWQPPVPSSDWVPVGTGTCVVNHGSYHVTSLANSSYGTYVTWNSQ